VTTNINKIKYAIILLTIVASIAFLSPNLFAPLNHYDESIMLLNSSNIVKGLIPYKHFWTLYFPGYYYLLAGIFKIFGTNILTARITDLFFRFLISLGIFYTSKNFIGKLTSLIPFLVSILWLGSMGFYLYPYIPAIALILLALLCLMRFFRNKNKLSYSWIILCGLLSGFVFIIRWDFGLYTAITFCLAIFFEVFCHFPIKTKKEKLLKSFIYAFILLACMFLLVIPFILFVGAQSGFEIFWEEAFVSPILINHYFRNIPPPSLLPKSLNLLENPGWIYFYFPLILTIIQLGRIIHYFRGIIVGKQTKIQPNNTILLIVSVLCLFSLLYGTSRYDVIHIIPAQLWGLLLFTSLCADFFKVKQINKELSICRAVIFVLLLLYLSPVYIFRNISEYVSIVHYVPEQSCCYLFIERPGCATIDNDTKKVVYYLQSVTKENEPIFVGNIRHDKIFVNDLSIYFLSDRNAPSEYQELYPGVATTLPVQEKIVQSLKNNLVNYVVLVNFPDSKENNSSSKSSGVFYLDEFIRDNYSPVFKTGIYLVMKEKNSLRP
jgi:hypothetical protein